MTRSTDSRGKHVEEGEGQQRGSPGCGFCWGSFRLYFLNLVDTSTHTLALSLCSRVSYLKDKVISQSQHN